MDLTKFQELHDDTRLAGKVQAYREIREGPALLDLGADLRDEFGPENCRRTVAGMLVDELRKERAVAGMLVDELRKERDRRKFLEAENRFLALQLEEEHRANK